MKTQFASLKIKFILLVGIITTLLTACSTISPMLPGGTDSQVLSSKLPRAQANNLPAGGLDLLVSGNTAFALDLYQQLDNLQGNLFFSPYSISSALAMTYAGAQGATAEEMAATLHFQLGEDKLHPAFNVLDQHLTALANSDIPEDQGDPFQLKLANAIWGQKDFHFEDIFLDTLAENYGAGLRLLDYIQQPEESRQDINKWVSDQTQDKIKDLIPQGAIDSNTRMVLSNAIYFKATWLEPFNKDNTEAGIFTGLNGEQLSATMMQQGSTPSLLYYQGDGYQAVELPYVGGEVSMLILLPDQGNFQAFESGLSGEVLSWVEDSLIYTPVNVTMPKFEYASEISLADTLSAMGMPTAFSDLADFSGMTGNKDLFISDVFHKAYINVNEEGTEAAAATAVIMSLTSMPVNPVELVIDRPFLFLIREQTTKTILFMGRVVSP